MSLSFMKQHLYLDRLVARKKRENGVKDEEAEAPLLSGSQVSGFFS